MDNIAKARYNVGDKVRVSYNDNNGSWGWGPRMVMLVGEVVTIYEVRWFDSLKSVCYKVADGAGNFYSDGWDETSLVPIDEFLKEGNSHG